MEIWKSESNSASQTMLAAGCALVGLILIVGFRNFSGFGSNAMAGFLLGVLLLIIGLAGFLFSGKQTVTVDPKSQRIAVEDANRFHKKTRVIFFRDIVSVHIGYLGKKSNDVTCYFLVLKLKSGEEYSLFAPGRFYAGASDRSTVENWKQRLEKYLALQEG